MKRALGLSAVFVAAVSGASGQDIRPAAQRIANAWQRADVGVIADQVARSGLSLDFGGQRVGPVAGRQATTMLRRVFEERETMSVRVGSVKEMEGKTRRGYVEVSWTTRARGTSIPDTTTVLFSLELDGDQWRITEIRLMR